MIWRENMVDFNDSKVKIILIIILSIIGLLFFFLCIQFGLSAGNEIGKLIYNLKH
jgi:hypothetical protein